MIPARAYRLDAASIVTLRDDLARWLVGRGVDQWQVGEVGVEDVRGQIEAGQWWVLRDDGAINATIRLMDADPEYWDDLVPDGDDGDATYVHGLMVRRTRAGLGLGELLLDFAAEKAAAAGHTYLRLDARTSNPGLCAYYRRLGFTERGIRSFAPPWGDAVRFERTV